MLSFIVIIPVSIFCFRLMTQDEFILPLGFEQKTAHDDEDMEGGHHTLKRALSNAQNLSIRPELKFPEEG